MAIDFEIIEKIGSLSKRESGWTKELNVINWAGKGPKFDVREWSVDHDKMGKGITFSEDELYALHKLLQAYFGNNPSEKHKSESIESLLLRGDK